MFLSKVILINAQHFPYMPVNIFSIGYLYLLNLFIDSLILFLLFKEKIEIDISLIIYNFIVNSFIDLLYYAVLLISVRFDYHMLEYFQSAGLYALIISDIIYIYCINKFNVYIVKTLNQSLTNLIKIIPFILLLELATFSIIYNNYIGILMNNPTKYSIYTTIHFLGTLILLVVIFRNTIKKDISDNMIENYNVNLNNLELQKEQVNNRKIQISKLKNDLNNNLMNYNETNNETISEEFQNMASEIICNNFAVSSTIKDFSRKCKENNIKFSYKVYFNVDSYLTDVDRVSLLSNLLQNAFEEVININDITKKTINLKIQKSNGIISIECRNYKAEKRTLVVYKKISGEGTKIIRAIVSKLDGKIIINDNKKEYSTLIIFYYNKEGDNNDL
jgi:hypothetical protein